MSEPIPTTIVFPFDTTLDVNHMPILPLELDTWGSAYQTVIRDRKFIELTGDSSYYFDTEVLAVLAYLEENLIPYRASAPAKYEYAGEIRVFGANRCIKRTCDNEGDIILAENDFKTMRAKHPRFIDFMVAIDDWFDVPAIEDLKKPTHADVARNELNRTAAQ
jgi:hypothetical protein